MKKGRVIYIFLLQVKCLEGHEVQDGKKVENQVFKNSEDKPKGIAKQASFKAKAPKKMNTGLKSVSFIFFITHFIKLICRFRKTKKTIPLFHHQT